MAKTPVISVVLDPDAPIGELLGLTMEIEMPPGNTIRYINCQRVEATDFGFLRLVPLPEDLHGVELGVFLPPSSILYMLQGDWKTSIGF